MPQTPSPPWWFCGLSVPSKSLCLPLLPNVPFAFHSGASAFSILSVSAFPKWVQSGMRRRHWVAQAPGRCLLARSRGPSPPTHVFFLAPLAVCFGFTLCPTPFFFFFSLLPLLSLLSLPPRLPSMFHPSSRRLLCILQFTSLCAQPASRL
ncbi:hypothetical protein LY78DRAFT_25590 [Colletotrichum sublineola]|nr:hypothetical protein LY78DRAFT_25590 [Colletotrichum sublineola]